jgi:hypothetical protein
LVGQITGGGAGGFGASATTGALCAQLKSETHDRMAIAAAPARVNVAVREPPRFILSLRLAPRGATPAFDVARYRPTAQDVVPRNFRFMKKSLRNCGRTLDGVAPAGFTLRMPLRDVNEFSSFLSADYLLITMV